VAKQAQQALAQKAPEQCHADEEGHFACGNLFQDELPIRWTRADWQRVSGSTRHAFFKVLGMLLSAIAISMGAPFWFDLLRRIARGLPLVGKKPEKPEPQAAQS